jgi:iron complex outermembrane recepter protein
MEPDMTYDVRFLRRPLVLALAAALSAPALVLAQSSSSSDDDEDTKDAELDRITVVGSRIKRAEVEGPAPVTVITREDIDREGYQTVADILQTLNQNTTSSFTGDLAVTGFSPNAQVVNLRNLGPGYTLTLINGRRPAQYPQPYNRDNNVVNVRAIPSAIIERVEILTGGASAIYGADAVAGVVNIVTRKGYEGDAIKFSVGTTQHGGGDFGTFEYTGGRTGDRWNAIYAFQWGDQEPVFASQRDFLADTRSGPLGANVNPALSLIVIRASAHPSGPTNHNAFYPGQEVCDRFGYTTVTTAARGTYCGDFDRVASRTISNAYKFYSGYGAGTFDISDETQLFGAVTYYKSDAKASSGTEFWGTSGDPFNRNAAGGTTAFYFDPSFGHLVQLQRTFNPFELGGSEAVTTNFDEKTYDITAGIRSTLADRFDWEASVMHSEYDYVQDRPRLLAQAIHDYFLGPQQGFVSGFPVYTLNRERWVTPFTPEQYQAVATRVQNIAETSSTTANFTITGDLWELPAGNIGFAGVAEWGSQEVNLESDPRLNPLRPRDNQTVYNLVSSGRTEGDRDRYALGAEFRIPLLASVTANLAARWDKYDDISEIDDAITYQGGLEWRPMDSLLIRGSFATSFRAPDMQLVYAEGAASFSGILDDFICRSGTGPAAALGPRTRAACNRAGDPTIYTTQTTIAGNPLLKEEEGESYSAGFVWDIMEGMSFSADYYRIKLEDAASQLSSAFLLNNEANCRLGVFPDLLVTCALPYANGHCTSAIWSATSRPTSGCARSSAWPAAGHFVCADDTHGTPIMLAARRPALAPEEFIAGIQAEHERDFAEFGVAFDHYHSTHSPREPRADRALLRPRCKTPAATSRRASSSSTTRRRDVPARPLHQGRLPELRRADQYGDNCEVCGATYAPTDLKNPRSVVSGATPELRESEHYFFEVWAKFEPLPARVAGRRCRACRRQGQAARVAGRRGRPARLGHLARRALLRLRDPRRARQVLLRLAGRADRLPGQLQGAVRARRPGFRPRRFDLLAPGSAGRAAPLHRQGHRQLPRPVLAGGAARRRLPPARPAARQRLPDRQRRQDVEVARHLHQARTYLDAGLNPSTCATTSPPSSSGGVDDLDLNLDDFAQRVNSDLVGKFVNIASRCAGFIEKRFGGQLAAAMSDADLEHYARRLRLSRPASVERGAYAAATSAPPAPDHGRGRRHQRTGSRAASPWAWPSRRAAMPSCTRSARWPQPVPPARRLLAPVLPRVARDRAFLQRPLAPSTPRPALLRPPHPALPSRCTRIDPKQIEP